ncbi:MAG: hypothetical protein RJA59_1642 [Pseudomonadota bacterium]
MQASNDVAPRPKRRALAAVALVILSSAAATGWMAIRRTDVPAPGPGPAPEPGPAAASPPAPEPTDAPDPRAAFLAARAAFTCGDVTGEAVFVGPERAIASIPCPDGQGQVRLSDGRDLLARVRPGAPPGTAVLDLPAASAPFVSPGAATALADGAALLVAIEGAGPETIGEATARGLVPVDGLPLLRAEEAAGPLGGPVVDAAGRLVGIAPSIPADPDRPWLAVPVEAFAAALGRDTPAAWTPIAEQAADEDRRSQGELWNRLQRSAVLLAASPGPNGVALVVARAAKGRPPAETVRLAVDPPARDCDPAGRIVDWKTGPHAFDGLPVPPVLLSRIVRIVAPDGGGTIWAGTGLARLDCDPSLVADGATLSIPGSDPPVPVPFPRGAAGQDPRPASGAVGGAAVPPTPEEAQALAAAAEQEAAWEVGWRQAFREANDRIAQARQRRLDIQAQREEARGNFQYVLEQQLDGDLEIARLEERRAAEALDDLDRRASLAAVPRAWRRAE